MGLKNENENQQGSANAEEEELTWGEASKDLLEGFGILFDALSKKLNAEIAPKKLKWDEFMQSLSNKVDRETLDYQKQSGYVFLGGKCRIYIKNGKSLAIECKKYFSNPKTEEIKCDAETKEVALSRFDFDDMETKHQIMMIEKQECIMDIVEPESGVN